MSNYNTYKDAITIMTMMMTTYYVCRLQPNPQRLATDPKMVLKSWGNRSRSRDRRRGEGGSAKSIGRALATPPPYKLWAMDGGRWLVGILLRNIHAGRSTVNSLSGILSPNGEPLSLSREGKCITSNCVFCRQAAGPPEAYISIAYPRKHTG